MNQFIENEQMFLVWAVIIGTLSLALLALSIIWKFTPTTVTQKIRWTYDWAMRHKTSLIILILFLIGMKFFVEYQEQVRMLKGTIVAPAAPVLSFPENVELVTPSGLVLIKDIKVGDLVTSFDTETGVETTSTVMRVFTRMDDELVVINHELRVTRRHPFAVRESGSAILWKEAGDIVSGDCLFSTLEHCVKVENVFIAVGDPEHVYNIHVTGPENYFVLMNANPILVHNKTVPTPEQQAQAHAYHALITEINTRYPGANMESHNGYYSIHPEGMEETRYPFFKGDQVERNRIPLDQIKESIEKTLRASQETKP